MTYIPAVIGVFLLIFGRRLFWLFVGAVGFVGGMALASWLLHEHPHSVQIVVALGIGIIGALLAVLLQKIVVSVVGFIAGGYVFISVAERFRLDVVYSPWLPIVVGGVCGAILMTILFEWALIVLSSLVGSLLIVQSFDLSSEMNVAMFLLFSIIGIVIQTRSKEKKGVGKK